MDEFLIGKLREYEEKCRQYEDVSDILVGMGKVMNDSAVRIKIYADRIEQLEAQLKTAQVMLTVPEVIFKPRFWDREMSDAWHQNIPNLDAAFEALLIVAEKRSKP